MAGRISIHRGRQTRRNRLAPVAEALESRWLLSVKYIDPNPAIPGPRDGSDWTHAYADLAPILAVAVSGDELHVAALTSPPSHPPPPPRNST